MDLFSDHKIKVPKQELYKRIVKFMRVRLCIAIGPFKNFESISQVIAVFKIAVKPCLGRTRYSE